MLTQDRDQRQECAEHSAAEIVSNRGTPPSAVERSGSNPNANRPEGFAPDESGNPTGNHRSHRKEREFTMASLGIVRDVKADVRPWAWRRPHRSTIRALAYASAVLLLTVSVTIATSTTAGSADHWWWSTTVVAIVVFSALHWARRRLVTKQPEPRRASLRVVRGPHDDLRL